MRQRSKRSPIPLPDAEAVARCTIVAALSIVDQLRDCPGFERSRVLEWATEAEARGLALLALAWPDNRHCFALGQWSPTEGPVVPTPSEILAAYRHAHRDLRASELFRFPGTPTQEGV